MEKLNPQNLTKTFLEKLPMSIFGSVTIASVIWSNIPWQGVIGMSALSFILPFALAIYRTYCDEKKNKKFIITDKEIFISGYNAKEVHLLKPTIKAICSVKKME